MRLVASVVCFVLVSSPAYAYIDPSIGAMALQGVMAAIAVVGIAIGTARHKLRSFFGKIRGGKGEESPNSATKVGEDD